MSELIGNRRHQCASSLKLRRKQLIGSTQIMIRIEDVLTVKRELQFLFVTIAYAEIKKPITIRTNGVVEMTRLYIEGEMTEAQ